MIRPNDRPKPATTARWGRGRLAIIVGLALGVPSMMGARCKPKPQRVPPLCAFEADEDEEVATKMLPPNVWLSLISPSVDIQAMVRRGPLRDSCGLVVEDISDDARYICDGLSLTPMPPPETSEVREDNLVMTQIGDDRVLIWAATDDVGEGELSGILSLALWAEKGLEIHATGPLRAQRAGARMRLAYIADTPVVIVESDLCEGPEAVCRRVVQFVPIIDRRVRELPAYTPDGTCLGRALFELSRKEVVDLNPPWSRRFEMVRSIEITDGEITLTDLITMHDINRNTSSPPTPFRRVVARRALELDLVAGRLIFPEHDLWERVLVDQGSAEVRSD